MAWLRSRDACAKSWPQLEQKYVSSMATWWMLAMCVLSRFLRLNPVWPMLQAKALRCVCCALCASSRSPRANAHWQRKQWYILSCVTGPR